MSETRLCTKKTWPSRSSSRRIASTTAASLYSPTWVRIGRRSAGGVVIIDRSRMPTKAISRVRGIGLALSVKTSTPIERDLIASLWVTPNRCSSSTTRSPRSLNPTFSDSSRCVPITTSTLPSFRPASVSLRLGVVDEATEHRHLHGKAGEAVAQGGEVLTREQRRGHQHRRLLAVLDRLEDRAYRDLGLAEADVGADQSVHRTRQFHVGLHVLDRLGLVGGQRVGEEVLHLALPLGVGDRRRDRRRRCVGDTGRRAPGRPGTPRRAPWPGSFATRRRPCARAPGARPRVRGEGVDHLGRPVAATVLELEDQVVARRAVDRPRRGARESRHAVLAMHHQSCRPRGRRRIRRRCARACARRDGPCVEPVRSLSLHTTISGSSRLKPDGRELSRTVSRTSSTLVGIGRDLETLAAQLVGHPIDRGGVGREHDAATRRRPTAHVRRDARGVALDDRRRRQVESARRRRGTRPTRRRCVLRGPRDQSRCRSGISDVACHVAATASVSSRSSSSRSSRRLRTRSGSTTTTVAAVDLVEQRARRVDEQRHPALHAVEELSRRQPVERRSAPRLGPRSCRSARVRASLAQEPLARRRHDALRRGRAGSAGWRCRRTSAARPRHRRSRGGSVRGPGPARGRRCRRARRTRRGARRGSRGDSRMSASDAMNSSRSSSLPASHASGAATGSGERIWVIERAEATMTRGESPRPTRQRSSARVAIVWLSGLTRSSGCVSQPGPQTRLRHRVRAAPRPNRAAVRPRSTSPSRQSDEGVSRA